MVRIVIDEADEVGGKVGGGGGGHDFVPST